MNNVKKPRGNTNPRWFVREQQEAWKQLGEIYGSTRNTTQLYAVAGDDRVIEGWHCWNGKAFELVEIHIVRNTSGIVQNYNLYFLHMNNIQEEVVVNGSVNTDVNFLNLGED